MDEAPLALGSIAELEAMFGRRTSPRSSSQEGSALGLWLCRGLILAACAFFYAFIVSLLMRHTVASSVECWLACSLSLTLYLLGRPGKQA
jgi:hypothetical protein